MIKCVLGHSWGFPRKRLVGSEMQDQQRCTECGRTRKSIVQFGPLKSTREEVLGIEPPRAVEVQQ